MAGAAVQSPPALPVFADNREFYREFCKIAVLGTLETATNCVVRAPQGREFPAQRNRELFHPNRVSGV